jgi:GT2 family glycosyltransferase
VINVLACIPTRDGNPPPGPFDKLGAACQHVAQTGRAAASIVVHESRYGVANCRNKAVADFLQAKDYTHLLFVDDDVYVPQETLLRLLMVNKDIACGCYPSIKHRPGELQVVTYVVVKERGGWHRNWFKGVRKVEAAGTGCMLIKRSVFDRIAFPWFRWGEYLIEGQYKEQSDDVDFCTRCNQAGVEVWADGDVRCGHVKPVDVSNFVTDGADEVMAWRE